MQAQQLYNEVKRLRVELEKNREEKDDLREELKEMTQHYLMMKQERDRYRGQMDNVKKDYENMDKIIKDNVERALKTREKHFQDMQNKLKESHERVSQLENYKKCYSNTINYLEQQISTLKEELATEKERNFKLQEESNGNENVFLQGGVASNLYDEKARLKQLQYEDEAFIAKYNQNDMLEQTNYDDGGHQNLGRGQGCEGAGTTEGDDCSYEEATNCRLRDETHASMIFGLNSKTAPVHIDHINLQVKSDSSTKKVTVKQTPTKVTPTND